MIVVRVKREEGGRARVRPGEHLDWMQVQGGGTKCLDLQSCVLELLFLFMRPPRQNVEESIYFCHGPLGNC